MFSGGKGKKERVLTPWVPGTPVDYIKKEDGKVYVENCGQEYPIMQEEDFLKFRDFADDISDAWTLRLQKGSVYVWDRPSIDKTKSSINMVKLFSEFPVAPETMYDCLHDADYRAVWDTSMGEGYNICHLDDNNDIGYYMLKLPAVVANRDFCNERSWRNVDGREFIIMNHSVLHEKCPPTKAVRGISVMSGYLIRPHGTGCSITYVSQSDPKGWIPVKIMNSVITSQGPNLIEKLKEVSKEYPAWREKRGAEKENFPWRTDPQPWSAPQPDRTIVWYCEKNGLNAEEVLGKPVVAVEGNGAVASDVPVPPAEDGEEEAPPKENGEEESLLTKTEEETQ
eukprot:TRINITY_DN7864_c2_g1_i1.p1 TRINITY_DN7864_c2_g1~~TRINITY_DN7864_c2_g1_i1.p1  ORF type:complete len:339 (+),score=87.03 TRINITY_DN7864_c2_g1_i1:543-1559(+)